MQAPSFELSIESTLPGRVPRLIEHYRRHGELHRPHPQARFCGAWFSEFGSLNRLYLLWQAPEGQALDAAPPPRAPDLRAALPEVQGIVTGVERLLLCPAHVPMNGVPPGSAWDLRFYDVQPYRVEDYMRELMAVMPVREKHSLPFGIWRQVSGPIDRIVHLWPYRDLAHRNEARAGVAREAQWQGFVERAFDMLAQQQSSLLRQVDDLLL